MFSFLINIFCFSTLQHNILSEVSVGIMTGPRQTGARHHFMMVVRRDNHDQMNHSSLVFYFGIRTVTCCCVTVFMCFFSWCVSCKRCWDILLFWPRFSLLMPALSTRTFFKLYSYPRFSSSVLITPVLGLNLPPLSLNCVTFIS